MGAVIKMVQVDGNLVARYGQELNEPELEALCTGMSLLKGGEKLQYIRSTGRVWLRQGRNSQQIGRSAGEGQSSL